MRKNVKKFSFLLSVTLIAFFFLFTHISSARAVGTQILSSPWRLTGNNGSAEKSVDINQAILQGKDTLRISYDLHGTCLLNGDASAIIFDQPKGVWRYVSLYNYGQKCLNGSQTVDIPLSQFGGLNTADKVSTFHVRFWQQGSYTIDISSVEVVGQTAPTLSPTPSSAPSVTIQPTVAPTVTSSPVPLNNLLTAAWTLTGNNGSTEKAQAINVNLSNKKALRITYNLNGLCILGGDASAIILDQPGSNWHYASLSKYGKNCYNGEQSADIPLSAFSGLNTTGTANNFHVRFWAGGSYTINIKSISFIDNGTVQPAPSANPTVTPIATLAPTSVPSTSQSWAIQSVSSMKETKDKICGQDDQNFINQWVNKAVELGANYVAVETPYDNPSCADALSYTKKWVDAIRARNLKVWHRHMPLAFEGIYSVTKSNGSNYLTLISNYIKNNPSLFVEGDIFTPIPEPQNGGISGITYCSQNVCQFNGAAQFNQWLRDAIDTSNNAFSSVGLGGKMKVGYYGFDGFVAWGSENPDWNGILEDATVQKMGNITIDHYPELINSTMATGLSELHTRYPNTPIIIGEWGSTGTTDLPQQVRNSMGAAKNASYVVGFNYWHMGMGGNEALINNDFTNRPQFATVQSYFKP